MIHTIHHLIAALQSPAHYKHELLSMRPLEAKEFDGPKSGIHMNPDALAALEGCQERGKVVNGQAEGLECTTIIDAMTDGAILRCITTPKDAPSAGPDAFANLVQRWSLDMQMALDMALVGDFWYGWVCIEAQAPYATALYTPSAMLITSGKLKLAKAIHTIKTAETTQKFTAYTGTQTVHVPKWRQQEIESL